MEVVEAPPRKRKIIIDNSLAFGDVVMLAVAVRSLMLAHADKFEVDVRSFARAVWENNPYLTPLRDDDPEVERIRPNYPNIHRSNQNPVHYVHGYREDLEEKLGVRIPEASWSGSIAISPLEHSWYSAPREILGRDVPYWVVNAGWKQDYDAKQWATDYYQQVIDSCPDVHFVQVGLTGNPHHVHPRLTGPNLINLLGRVDERQLIRLIYASFGVLTPVSVHMLLSYTIPPYPLYNRKSRACIVLAGGREPNHWQQGPNQQYLHTCGMLPCCDNGGCWKARVRAHGDGDPKDASLCLFPVKMDNGQTIAKCMSMITPDQVTRLVRQYMDNLEWRPS